MKFINIFLILITINIFSQNWSDTPVPININVTGYDYSQGDRVELHTNKWGNNLIVLNNGVLGFYRFSVTGNIEYSNPNWLTGVEYANISGDENLIYVVFKKDNVIQAKYSTTGGTFWWSRPNVPGSEGAFLVDAAYSSAYGLFVVWGSAGYIKYYRYKESISAWIEPFTVSNNPAELNPRVIYKNSQSRVYVTYQKSNISGKYRYCNLSSNPVVWSAIKDGYNRNYSESAGFAVDDYYIYLFHTYSYYPETTFYCEQIYLPNEWHNPYPFRDNTNLTYYIESTTTRDNTVYAAHWYNWSTGGEDYLPGIYAAKFIGDGVYHYELIFRDDEQNAVYDILRISSISNDVHVIWQDNQSYPHIRYSYKDLPPLAPQNLTITKSPNNHPLLSWTANKEPDIGNYKIYRMSVCHFGWQLIGQTGNLSYEDQTLSYCTAQPPEQCTDLCLYSYRITAVDLGLHESDPSNTVSAYLTGGGPPTKPGANDPESVAIYEYSLMQNYPNPFNPITTINYSIKSSGMATLKVYDMLGKEVASLVNENKEAGNYLVEFNAANLPSGIYFYTLTSGNFMYTKKLILLK